MYKFKIEKIHFNIEMGKMEFVPKSVNIIVGSNNAGKSRILKELRDFFSGDHNDLKIIDKVEYSFPKTFSDFNEEFELDTKVANDKYGNYFLKAYNNKAAQPFELNESLESFYTRPLHSFSGNLNKYISDVIDQHREVEFLEWCGALLFQYVGTEERLMISKMQNNYGLDRSSTNYLSSIKHRPELLDSLRTYVKKVFYRDILLDTITLGDRLVFRVGENFDYLESLSSVSEEVATNLYKEPMLDDQGDGLKSFVATFLSLNVNHKGLLLLDEPEAFLHPPLARQIGEMIGDCLDEDKTVFVATHSVEVLKGILSKNTDVNVLRITQPQMGVNQIKLLDQTILQSILINPLLRVSRVLEGIFCDKVIITEAEADELVYQELIEKVFPGSGLYFAHGQNKQTLSVIAELYKKLDIAYGMIVDFDILRNSNEFYKLLSVLSIEENERQQLKSYAEKLKQIADEDVEKQTIDDIYHKQGIRYFANIHDTIKKTLRKLSDHHLHILETGELETLLEEYGLPYNSNKKQWIVEAIKKLDELEASDIPKDSVLYQFLSGICKIP